jgi:hypothetical protein
MPILSSTPTTNEKYTCCPVPCKHNKPMQPEENETLCIKSSNERKKTSSLVSRNEDDYWVDISDRRLRNSRLGALYDGSQFKGVQKCGTSKYNVLVDIKVNPND